MERKRYIIFDNYDVYSEDNREIARENLETNEQEITEENILEECNFQNEIWFEEEQSELERVDEGCTIIAIADVGRWDGRVTGYKEIKKLSDILYSSSGYETVYVDSNGDIRKDESHHDGSNSILYRYVKDGVDLERLEDKIYNGECTKRDITRYTRKAGLGIARAYGWKVRGA